MIDEKMRGEVKRGRSRRKEREELESLGKKRWLLEKRKEKNGQATGERNCVCTIVKMEKKDRGKRKKEKREEGLQWCWVEV